MSRILPIKFQEAKEASENFFIELYRINLKSGMLRFAACDQDITFAGEKYLAVPIERTDYTQTVDPKVDNLELRIGNVDQGITQAVFGGLDFRGRECELIRIMYPDSVVQDGDTPEDIEVKNGLYLPVFCGVLDSPYMNNTEFKVSVLAKAPTQDAPNRKCQLSCNAVFADPDECGVSKIVRSGTVGEGSTQSHIVDSGRTEESGFWQDGIVTLGFESRRVNRYENGIVYLEYPFVGVVSGSYLIEQGCDKTFKTCKERFNNGRNFSGFPSIPFEIVIKS